MSLWTTLQSLKNKNQHPGKVLVISCAQRYIFFTATTSIYSLFILIHEVRDKFVAGQSVFLKVRVLFCLQARRRAEKVWKNEDKATRKLLFCALSALLKFECCGSAVHTMDDLDLNGFSTYESIPGVDCMFPRFVVPHLNKYE